MKKEAILILLLLAGIPGCCVKKCNTPCCDVPAGEQAEEVQAEDTEFVAASDLDIRSFFNDETGTFEISDDEFETNSLEEWVFADGLDFPTVMAEKNEDKAMPETVEVAVVAVDVPQDVKKKTVSDSQSLEEESFKTVFFDANSANLREDQKEIVEHNIARAKTIMNEYDNTGNLHQCTLVIEGHIDDRSEDDDISQLRARVLADAFVAAGIPEECICVEARGADIPMIVNGKPVDADSMEQWANRRSEIHMICA